MVSNWSIIFMFISLTIVLALPIGLAIYFVKKEKASIKSILVGALVFIVFQILTRVPLLQALSQQAWYFKMASNVVLLGIFLGLTAGLFEEIGRFLGFKLLLKNRLSWADGVAFGIGHGSIEAILLVGLSFINSIFYSFSINSGTFDSITANLPSDAVYLLKNQLINTPSHLFLTAGVERIFAMALQIAFTLVVLYGVKKKAFKYVVLAICLHFLVDSPLPLLMASGLNIWVIEIFVGICAAIALYFIIKSKEIFRKSFDEAEEIKL